MSRGKKTSTWRILVALILLAALVGALYVSYLTNAPPDELAYRANVNLRIRDLRIDADLTIPANIGVPGGFWMNHTLDSMGGVNAPLFTVDTSGTIHIETRVFVVFTLGDFFNIWGEQLSATCVWNYCASAEPGPGHGPPIMSTKLRGFESFVERDYPLRSQDEILILIGTG